MIGMAVQIELSELITAGLVSVLTQGRRTSVSTIHFHGEEDAPKVGSLIAAAGATDARQQAEAIALAAATDAGAVIVRRLASSATERLARKQRITLAELGPQVEWSHLIWFVRCVMDRGTTALAPESAAQQGLFAMADAVAAMLNAPVTIEDAHSRVIAYSATTDGADMTRTSTIMSRSVPPAVLRRLRATGVLKKLTHASRPFTVPALEPGFLQRLVIPLRLGGQTVGSIWAIWDGDLDPQLETQLSATGTAAAMSLVQLSTSLDVAGRYSLEGVRAALRGDADQTTGGLNLPFDRRRVVALQRLSGASPTDDISLWRTFFRKKSWPDPIIADVDGLAFAIVPERPGPGGWPWLCELARSSAPGRLAASRPASGDAGLAAARLEAAEALSAVCALSQPVGAYEEVWDTVVLRRASAAVASVEHENLRLLFHDQGNGAQALADTLRVWLECGGDIREAATILHMHPNSVRHRLKKIDQRIGDSLRTSSQRLAALMLLRGWEGAMGSGVPGRHCVTTSVVR